MVSLSPWYSPNHCELAGFQSDNTRLLIIPNDVLNPKIVPRNNFD